MNDKRTEDPITDIKVRLAKLEDNHHSVRSINEEWPILEARVSNLEKNYTIIDSVKTRVDKIETNLEVITTKVSDIDDSTKKLTIDVSEFKENMRKEFNRLIFWIAAIIVGSLVGGLAAMYQHQDGVFREIGIQINNVEDMATKKCNEIEKDIIKMNVRIDTIGRD